MTDVADELLDAVAAVTGRSQADVVADVASMSLHELEDLLAGAHIEWSIVAVARVQEEIRRRAEHQTIVDTSIGGRRGRSTW